MSTYYYNGNEYQSRSPLNGLEGYFAASVVSGAILSPLAYLSKPVHKQLKKEEVNNHVYKDYFIRAYHDLGISDKLSLLEAQNETKLPPDYRLGMNAAFDKESRSIIINTDKICCAGFHELGHALNELKSKYGVKYLAKMRYPGYVIAGLMEYFAIFSRTKPKDAPRNVTDIIEDNCGKIAFIAMLPIAAEEAVASYRGLKLAKKVGLPKQLYNNVRKLSVKAFMTYGGWAVLGGIAVYASRKIMDYFTRPKVVKNYDLFG